MAEPKRRRVATASIDSDYVQAAPTTSRTAAKAAAAAAAAAKKSKEAEAAASGGGPSSSNGPLVDLNTLPPEALQRYLSRYGLMEPQGVLSYHHAVFPVPRLPSSLKPVLDGRTLAPRQPRHALIRDLVNETPPPVEEEEDPMNQALDNQQQEDQLANAAAATLKRKWQEPKAAEFANLSAMDTPDVVQRRLAAKAIQHWHERTNIKEGETLTNFMFAVRMRGQTLKATPPG